MDSCNTLLATQQMVFYETTNIIEVYIQNSPVCTNANHGKAVIGIQNYTGSLGYTPQNRNTSQWSTTNEAWRFTPNGLANYTISWYLGPTLISNNDTIIVCPTSTTTYTVQIVYTNASCGSTPTTLSDQVTVFTPLGINENNIDNLVKIYPNPANDNLTIETPPKSTIEISNIQGQLIKTLAVSGNKTNIDHVGWSSYVVDVSALPCGVYVVQVKTEKGIAVKKFVKE